MHLAAGEQGDEERVGARTVVDGTPLDAAVTYATNQEDALRRFLGDGRLPLDNNISERALLWLASFESQSTGDRSTSGKGASAKTGPEQGARLPT